MLFRSGKVAELAMILSNGGIDAAPAPKLAQPMPAEGVASYLDNVRQKARFVSQAMPGEYVLADDSGLTLAACPGQLGIRTAKGYVEATIRDTIQVGHGHGPLNHWAL